MKTLDTKLSLQNCSLNGFVNGSLISSPIYWLVILLGFSQPTLAAPSVLVDISPTHSLVSMVMGDIGEPQLLISSASNPHDFALRPSDASRLSSADLIFYTSSTLTPWLTKALKSLAQNTLAFELISTEGTVLLPLRNNHLFSHKGHEEHTSDVYDPHAWLDPSNAVTWLAHIAKQLAHVDTVNATTYQQNAERASLRIQILMENVRQELDGLQAVPYVVFHDSYQYFETRFNLQPKASISLGDGTKPGISQIRKLQAVIQSSQAQCVFSEPQYSDRLVNTVVSGLDINITQLDPLGFDLEPGVNLYISLLKNLSHSLFECLVIK
ncbi:MAG: zinc transport system substrate-binding protein [Granulosicoccus sp.]|jgi:zinc transport system substrate-binding protein